MHKRPGYGLFFAENPFSPADEFAFSIHWAGGMKLPFRCNSLRRIPKGRKVPSAVRTRLDKYILLVIPKAPKKYLHQQKPSNSGDWEAIEFNRENAAGS